MEMIIKEINWNDFIIKFVELALTVILIPCAKQLYSWMKAKADASKYKNLVKYIEMFMESIESADITGEDKKAWVIAKVEELGLAKSELASDIIEAVFRELDNAGIINNEPKAE